MIDRQLTFIDVDENRLELWLKPDRVQLVVIDSRPELEAGELRRFASVVFAEYVARDLETKLEAARHRLREARGQAAGDELAAALDHALRALDDLAEAVAVPACAVAASPEPEAEPAAQPATPPDPEPEPPIAARLTGRQPYRPLKPSARAKRAGERGSLGWARPRRPGPARSGAARSGAR